MEVKTALGSSSSNAGEIHVLQAMSELRFDVPDEETTVTLKLTRGSAEVFGAPMQLNQVYQMPFGKYAVFSWYDGTEILLTGCDGYVSDDTTMSMAVNLHGVLDAERERILASTSSNTMTPSKSGPKILITGPTDSGKSTLCKTLLAYAARRDRRPMFVDLDVGQGEISAPGVLAACTIETKNVSVEEGPICHAPLAFYFGDSSPAEHPVYYIRVIKQLIECAEARMQLDPLAQASGMVVNTCGWVEGQGLSLLVQCIQIVKPDIIVVLGDDRLLHNLKKQYPNLAKDSQVDWQSPKSIVKVQKSAGIVSRTKAYRSATRDHRIKHYFYGSPRSGLFSPSHISVPFDSVIVLRFVNEAAASDVSIRPVGNNDPIDPVLLQEVDLDGQLVHSVLGVSFAVDEESVKTSNIAGLVHVRKVDVDSKTLTLLSPMSGQLPGRYLLLGTIKISDL